MYMGGDGMIILDTMEQLHAQIDDKTLEKVQSTRDFVIKTGDDDILMTFRWLDHSVIVLHTEAEQTTLWAENPVVRRFAEDIEGTGREELFRFLVEVSADDLLKLDDLEDRVAAFETALFDYHIGKALIDFRFQLLLCELAHIGDREGRQLHLKRDSALEDDLFVKHIDCVGDGDAQRLQNAFGLILDLRLNARIQICSLSHLTALLSQQVCSMYIILNCKHNRNTFFNLFAFNLYTDVLP